jgi:hypothetical protein
MSRAKTPAADVLLVVPLADNGWKFSPEIVEFNIPIKASDSLLTLFGSIGSEVEINLQKSSTLLQSLAFVASRAFILSCFKSDHWLLLDRSVLSQENDEDVACQQGFPRKPGVNGRVSQKADGQNSCQLKMDVKHVYLNVPSNVVLSHGL